MLATPDPESVAVSVTSTLEEIYQPLLPGVPEVTEATVDGETLSAKFAVTVPGPLTVAFAVVEESGDTVISPVVVHEENL
jgi:hypothetical protein